MSEATVDLGHVVEAIKKIEEEGQGVSDEVKAEILKNDKEASTILEETGHIEIFERFATWKKLKNNQKLTKLRKLMRV